MALVALHIHFTGRLREGKVVGAEPNLRVVSVDLVHNGDQCALQIAHGDVLGHHQTFDLMEHGGVGGIGLVLAEHTAGCQHTQGRLVLLHEADLHGTGLGAQQDGVLIVEIEGVAAIPGGVSLFDVQPGEVVVRKLHFGTVHHGVAHAHEDILDLLQHHVHGMLVTQLHCVTGDGHVNGLGSQLCFQSPGTDGSLALFQLGFNFAADGVCHLTHDGDSLPIIFRTAVSSPFLPSSLTRSSSSAAGV